MLRFETFHTQNEFDLNAILDDDVTGFVYLNILTPSHIAMFKNAIVKLRDTFSHDLNDGNGFSLPGMFGQLHKTQPIEVVDEYFNLITPFTQLVNQTTNTDIGDWLKSTLQTYFKPYPIEILEGFLPYSFRIVWPKRGGLFLHKDGDLLPFIHDTVSERILQKIVPETMMSWFFTIQSPEMGGQLWVADKKYSNHKKEGQFRLKNELGHVITEAEMEHIEVSTPTGSLLLFKGGAYWHKVLPPNMDSIDRITLGGFMAKAKGQEKIYYWS